MRLILPLLISLFCASTNLPAQTQEGKASYYNDKFHGKKTASGELYDKKAYTAAHKTLPFGTKVLVTRLDNGKSVVVKVNDRGPFSHGLMIDLSRVAAEELGIVKEGTKNVKIEVIKENKEPENATASTSKVESTSPPIPRNPEDEEVVANMTSEGLYKIQVLKLEYKGYGVQIGTFKDYNAVLKKVSELQEDWFKNIMVHVTTNGKKSEYKLILGPFLDKKTSESYLSNITKKFKMTGGFVIDLNTLK